MNEEQVQIANDKVHRQQAANKTDRLGGIPLRAATSAKPSTPDFPCRRCGKKAYREGLCYECWPVVEEQLREARVKRATILAVIPPLFQKARMFHLSSGLQKTIDSLPAWKGLFLWSPSGVGKTYAMAVIARRMIWRGRTVGRSSYEMLCLEIRDTFKPKAVETELEVIKKYLKPDVLFIEDVGTTKSIGEQESDFSRRTFLVLLDQRLEQCKATFITSNKSVEDLRASFDSRIASRIQQACEVIELKGKDRRGANA